jgi:lactate dehydrogenase-like 2-hydroxyacid dehydrogenase
MPSPRPVSVLGIGFSVPMTNILVTGQPPGDCLDRLAEHGELEVWRGEEAMPRHALLEALADVDGFYSMLADAINAELLDAAPRLRVVSNFAVGVDNVDLAACTARGIPVGHTPDVLTGTTADTAFGLLIMAARRLVEGVDYVRAGRWQRWEPELLWGLDVHGTTLGIVGMGRIGRAIAERGRGFGMRVVYTATAPKPDVDAAHDARYLPLPELLAEADHVVVATALTGSTRHLIDAAALARMRPTATLVNISRGGTVDPDALYEALAAGRIAAAGLDVTEPEPIPPDHPLLGLANCVILPHLGSSSRATRVAMADLAADNLLAGLAGERLPACANPEVYAAPGG